MRRYPFAPVKLVIASRLGEHLADLGVPRMATFLEVHQRQVQRWRTEGITRRQGDRVARTLNLHAADLWPEVLDHDFDDVAVCCAAGGCDERFVPHITRGPKRQLYCSRRCRQRVRMVRYRANNPAAAQRHRDYQRRYRLEVLELIERRAAA